MIHQILLIIFVVIVTLGALNYVVDYIFHLKNRYCRFHIGRYSSIKEWNEKVEKRALKWLKRTPTVKITDNCRYMLLDIITGKYRSYTIQSWQKAALILGLLYSRNKEHRGAAKDAAESLIDENGQWKKKPVAVDCGMLSFALLKAIDDPDKVKPAMDESLAIIKKNINNVGMISYTGGRDNPDMYVDTIGLVCPFLVLYAKVYRDFESEELAFRQLGLFHKYGLYTGTALPNHAFHIKFKLPLGVYGWGRGTAWYFIGLMDSYPLFQKKSYKEQVKKWLIEAANCYLAYQRPDGGFGAILQRTHTYDSSVTCAMAWFYAQMKNICDEPIYAEASRRCLDKILSCTRITGAIDLCQGDTKDIGIFAQTYDVMPFAQGMVLRALNSKEEWENNEKEK